MDPEPLSYLSVHDEAAGIPGFPPPGVYVRADELAAILRRLDPAALDELADELERLTPHPPD